MLDRTRPDAVFDCTVPTAHRNVTLEALRRGIHVLGEKPLSDTLATAQEMVGASASVSGAHYAVMQNRRFDPNILRLREFLDSGAMGEVTTVDSAFYIAAHFSGFRVQMEHVLLLDMAIHTFDAARLITQADPLAVSCHEWNPSNAWMAHGRSGNRDLRTGQRHGRQHRLFVSRLLVRRGDGDALGGRVARSSAPKGAFTWDRAGVACPGLLRAD